MSGKKYVRFWFQTLARAKLKALRVGKVAEQNSADENKDVDKEEAVDLMESEAEEKSWT
jgi:hypothetical protein